MAADKIFQEEKQRKNISNSPAETEGEDSEANTDALKCQKHWLTLVVSS